jgi:hypothetical protein
VTCLKKEFSILSFPIPSCFLDKDGEKVGKTLNSARIYITSVNSGEFSRTLTTA